MSAFYLRQNQHAPAASCAHRARQGSRRKGGLPPHKSVLSLTWEVENPDDDRLRYRLHFRNEAHSAWLPILREHELLEQTDYEWETRTLPDGYYRVRVEVSDEASNPLTFMKRSEAISGPLLVDNHGPEVSNLRVQGKELSGLAKTRSVRFKRSSYH